jgi:hypothetical protein
MPVPTVLRPGIEVIPKIFESKLFNEFVSKTYLIIDGRNNGFKLTSLLLFNYGSGTGIFPYEGMR